MSYRYYSLSECATGFYDEAEELHKTNPDWYPNPDESTIVKGKELKEARADYQALVRRRELEKGQQN